VVFVLLAPSTVVAGGATHLQFTGFVSAVSPCNGEFVSGPVTTRITYHEVQNKNTTRASVHVNMHGGNLVGSFGNDYRVNLSANAQFSTIQNTYVFDHDSLEWIGKGSVPDFRVTSSTQNVFVSGGQPTGHSFFYSGAQAVCKQ
jgi:hypothetical protein